MLDQKKLMKRFEKDQLLTTFQIIHICGKENIDSSYEQPGYIQYEYVSDELKDLLEIADIVLSRAGANSIFEFLALNKPMLLIPLSKNASRGDQIVNAQSFKKQGYARVLEEENLTVDRLVQDLVKLQKEKTAVIEKMKNYQSVKAKDRVIEIIKEEAKK